MNQVLNSYPTATCMGELLQSLREALDDAGDDRIAEQGNARVHDSEVYMAPTIVDLLRERLTDGSYVYNLRLRLAK